MGAALDADNHVYNTINGFKTAVENALKKEISVAPNTCLLYTSLDRYGLGDWAKERYAAMPVKAGACVDCGACETRCPYNLPIRDMLKKCAEEFGE